MAKKVRFPLEMDGGIEVRDMESLRKNFSLQRVTDYFINGKLVVWLRDRYADNIADEIEKLKLDDKEYARKLCEILDVSYDEVLPSDFDKLEERNKKIEKLKKYSSKLEFLNNIDRVAFNQDELYDLLDENETDIYLCGGKFSIPLSKKGIKYVGVNNPIVIIDSKIEIDWKKEGIELVNVTYDDKYQAVVKSAIETKKKLYDKVVETVKNKSANLYGEYSMQSLLNFMLSSSEKKAAENSYSMIASEMRKLKYDTNANVKNIKERLMAEGIIGLANNYLRNL